MPSTVSANPGLFLIYSSYVFKNTLAFQQTQEQENWQQVNVKNAGSKLLQQFNILNVFAGPPRRTQHISARNTLCVYKKKPWGIFILITGNVDPKRLIRKFFNDIMHKIFLY